MAPTRVHQQLNPSIGQFRTLKLLPAKKTSDPICCEFVYMSLNLNEKYEALSYTWGRKDPDKAWSIILNGQPFEILENLDAALRRLRKLSKPRVIWIDAVCINQNDLQEKQEQILHMRQIYEQAEQVVIWLGEVGIGENIALNSLASPSGGFSLGTKVWRAERKFGLAKPIKERMAQGLTGEWDARAMEVGELAQLLDRPWWRRVWIVQEIVLAKRAIIMCGPDEVPWESIKTRMRSAMFGVLGDDQTLYLRHTAEGRVLSKYDFPNKEHTLLDDLQTKWRSKSWDQSLYTLLYTFRRFECTVPVDRVYAFLGLAKDIQELNITPDYTSPTSKVFIEIARKLIISDKHLLIFNLKRAPASQYTTEQQSQVYSLPDQAHFFDPDGLVLDGPGRTPRKGFARLPHGWERVQTGTRFRFYNHLTKLPQDHSPLAILPPALPQRMNHWRNLPIGWRKAWDNVGNAKYVFELDNVDSKPRRDMDLESLPSWVPNWVLWSRKDPEPFLSLVDNDKPRYWASGVARKVHFASGYDLDSNTLRLTGVLFDKIESIASPWCPEPHLLPISRSEIAILKEWETLATKSVPNCPYSEAGGRTEAFWRTHIADYAGARKATEKDRNYFNTWASGGEWGVQALDNFTDAGKSSWQKNFETPTQQQILGDMWLHMIEKGYEPSSISLSKNMKAMKVGMETYKEMRTRIYCASLNRAMFTTAKGYLGLAPWNAEKGDIVSVLFGGCTPFLLRKVPGNDQYTLVGETYVYGIMGGELFGGEMGHARLRAFDIV